MIIELGVVQLWSEIILVISNRTRAARSFNIIFEIIQISDQIALHLVQLPLLILHYTTAALINETIAVLRQDCKCFL